MRLQSGLLVSSLAIGVLSALEHGCKCAPTDNCWPTISEWNSFNGTIDGALIRAVPPGSVCYSSEPNFDEAACKNVLGNWTADNFQSSHPISGDSLFTNRTCDPVYENGTSIYGDASAGSRGCHSSGFPQYAVNTTKTSQIQAAISFSKEKNLRLMIKNTGHSGKSSPGSLSLWTHNMKDITYHEVFQAQGCSANVTWKGSRKAFTIGAGTQGRDLMAAMEKHAAVAVSGTSSDVGVVGWSTGGGHGFLTSQFGMGADNILEVRIVTADGTILVANDCQNSDIFWAVRGGGGGTFGVIVSMTMKAYPVPSVTVFGFSAVAKNRTSAKSFWTTFAKVHSLLPEAERSGMGGYYTVSGPSSDALTWSGAFLFWDKSNTTAENIVRPIRDFLSAANQTINSNLAPMDLGSYFDLLRLYPAGGGAAGRGISASRLITERVAREEYRAFAQTMEDIATRKSAPSAGSSAISMSGTMTIGHESVDNALNPAWRNTTVHLIVNDSWDDSFPASNISSIVSDMTYRRLPALQNLVPESGAYFNEANIYEPNWQFSFFGAHYIRLLNIKTKYDPEGVFWCNNCVGSENWVETSEGSLCHAYRP